MPQQVLEYLNPRPGGLYLDGTLGGAGHARLILEASEPDGRLIGLDRDPAALEEAERELAPYGDRAILRQRNFSEAAQVLDELGYQGLDGILLDLGVSSHQLGTPERGFSFQDEGPLDMRMNPDFGDTAADVVNRLSADDLAAIFRDLGEERFSRRIARCIVRRREEAPLQTTRELAELVRGVVPSGRAPSRIHPATRVFQALRIYVNSELEHIRRGVSEGIDLLRTTGRMVVISFHSLEDRIVKHLFRHEATNCVCPPRMPVCNCGHSARVQLLSRQAVRADQEEIEANPRSRSAILRAVERLA